MNLGYESSEPFRSHRGPNATANRQIVSPPPEHVSGSKSPALSTDTFDLDDSYSDWVLGIIHRHNLRLGVLAEQGERDECKHKPRGRW